MNQSPNCEVENQDLCKTKQNKTKKQQIKPNKKKIKKLTNQTKNNYKIMKKKWKEMVAHFLWSKNWINDFLIVYLIYVFKTIVNQTFNLLATSLHKKQKHWQ